MIFPNGDLLKGRLRDGKKQGVGSWMFREDLDKISEYQGQFQDDLFEGEGTLSQLHFHLDVHQRQQLLRQTTRHSEALQGN